MQDNLERFRKAQRDSYDNALRSHWMWYIFPQIAGLGYSETAQYYAIANLDEAKDFLKDEMLAILSDRNRIMQKRELENTNARWNEYLNQSIWRKFVTMDKIMRMKGKND